MKTNKKLKLENLVREILGTSIIEMQKKIEKVLNSEAVNIDSWEEDNAPMILPKSIVAAILEMEAIQYLGRGTSSEKQVRKNIKYIKYYN